MGRAALEFSRYARQRMARYGLTRDHVELVVRQNSPAEYQTRGADVYVGTLPDGRDVKVQVHDGTVKDAFIPK